MNKQHKDTCLEASGLCLHILLTTPHSTVNTIERTYVFYEEINKHAITTPKSKKGPNLDPIFDDASS